MKVGSGLIYSLGIPQNIDSSYDTKISLFLADAFRFASYDSELNLFKVNRDLTEAEDRGTYPILVNLRVNKGAYGRTYRFMFILTVWDDNPIFVGPASTSWFPPDPIIDNYHKIYYHGERIIKHERQDEN